MTKSGTRRRGAIFAIISGLTRSKASKTGVGIIVAILVIIGVGPFLVHYAPDAISSQINSPPTYAHLFGTDYLGRDILSQIIWGAYPSMIVGIIASVGAVLIGVLVGTISGYFTKLEGPLIGAGDVILAFPPLLLLILIGSLYVVSEEIIILILILVLWPPIARATRSQVLSIRERQYVESSKTSGLGNWSIIGRIILPSVTGIAFAYFTLAVAASIVLVTALEFLGVGNPNIVSWGSILYWAQQFAFYAGDWWWILAPGAFISLVALAFALIGFSFEEVMNPKLRT